MPSDDSDGDMTSSTLKPKNIIKGEPGPGVEDDITSIFFHYWRFLVPLFWCCEGFPENSVITGFSSFAFPRLTLRNLPSLVYVT